jgi:hypothetical protein
MFGKVWNMYETYEARFEAAEVTVKFLGAVTPRILISMPTWSPSAIMVRTSRLTSHGLRGFHHMV